MSMANSAAMNDSGRKITVTIVKTISVLPCRDAP